MICSLNRLRLRHDGNGSCFGNLWREETARDKWRWFGGANRVGDYDRSALEASPLALEPSIIRSDKWFLKLTSRHQFLMLNRRGIEHRRR